MALPQGYRAYLTLARPHQYLKNALIFAPLFFSGELYDTGALADTFLAFLAFCLAASAVYTLNDLCDAGSDRRHPAKRHRPVASGVISPARAGIFGAALLLAALGLALALWNTGFSGALGVYLIVNAVYSLFLKHYSVADVLLIASGFVIRIYAGGLVAGVAVSEWLIVITFLLSLFLALGKRRDDLLLEEEAGAPLRKSLDGYNLEFVTHAMTMMAAVVIVGYILYTVSPEVEARHGSKYLYLTGFWVIAGILRYLQLTLVERKSGSPTWVLVHDVYLQLTILMWVLSFFVIIYAS